MQRVTPTIFYNTGHTSVARSATESHLETRQRKLLRRQTFAEKKIKILFPKLFETRPPEQQLLQALIFSQIILPQLRSGYRLHTKGLKLAIYADIRLRGYQLGHSLAKHNWQLRQLIQSRSVLAALSSDSQLHLQQQASIFKQLKNREEFLHNKILTTETLGH